MSSFETLTEEDGKQLLDLCRTGKLYAVEKWISDGRSLRALAGRQKKKSPLDIAVDAGFHSLVELLARNEPEQAVKNKALAFAIEKRRIDLVNVLVAQGAAIRSVPLIDVLMTWDPHLIRFFLESGADAIKASPFAVAFAERIRTALRPFVDYRQAHPELEDQLQQQVDQALRYIAKENDLKWISLMLWAGANPRTPGPTLFEGHEDDPDWHTTAIDEACYNGNIEILKKFRIAAATDDLGELVGSALISRNPDSLDYLLSLGGDLNNKPNGGSTAMDRCLGHIRLNSIDPFRGKTPILRNEITRMMEVIKKLAAAGARWRPDEDHMAYVRKELYRCEPRVTVDIVKILAGKNAATKETLEELLSVPKMRMHLATLGINLPIALAPKTRAGRSNQSAKQAS
jgi:hypothetical protein